jgi:two-component system, OmpR family, bacitracin resistance response regulator BceR
MFNHINILSINVSLPSMNLHKKEIFECSFIRHMASKRDFLYNLCKQQDCVVTKLKLLLIEDDTTLFNEIKERLSQWSYDVYGITDFNHVMQEFTEVKPDLVIIDIQLPKFDGFHWCRMIRTHSNVPILFLSSRDHPTDMVMSMQLGADDFIQKPFHFDVLIAKVQATLRRVYNYNTEQVSIKTWCGATVDYERNTVANERGSIELTKNEMYILKLLIEQKNKIVSRDALINSLWDDKRFISDNTLTVNVNRLRKRLEEIELGRFIETKVGQGYMAIEEDSP